MKKDWEELKKEKQQVIFDSALRIIKEKGFHRARIADIAKEAGISYGLVYHYFKNKEDLLNEILNQWWVGLYQLLEDIQKTERALNGRLKGLILYFLDTYQRKPDLIHIFITQISRSATNLTETRLDNFKKFFRLMEDILTQGQKAKKLRKDIESRYLTYIFLGGVETFLSVMVLGEESIKSEQQKNKIADSILEVFLNGANALNQIRSGNPI
jgi:TetR/AcrR family transcriptional regulator, fatty acid metabolism regulator protein